MHDIQNSKQSSCFQGGDILIWKTNVRACLHVNFLSLSIFSNIIKEFIVND